jgi:chemotaxis protein histidine kinase CheA
MASKKKSGAAAPSARGRTAKAAAKKVVRAVKKAAATVSQGAAAKKKAGAKKKTAPKPKAKKVAAKKKPVAKKVAAKKRTLKKAAPKMAAVKKAAPKRGTPKKVAAKKAAPKKAAPKKAAPKKAAPKKAAPKKAAPKKAAPKKAGPKNVAPKKAGAKNVPPKKPAAKKVATKKVAPKKAASKKVTAKKRAAKKVAAKKKTAAKKPAARTTGPRTSRRKWQDPPVVPPGAIPGLSEEDQIRSAKYLPRELPKRLFEEERFLFPESYGVNRVRLLVRDPEWVFAYWDVSAETMKGLARSLGERAFKLSRLTLRVLDPVSGGTSDILLPSGSRWWYIRTDAARRTYRAEIGVTLPSGEFRRLAESNAVVTPRVGPSRERARRRLSYAGAGDLPLEEATAAGKADRKAGLASEPWTGTGEAADSGERGGASEKFRPARPGDEARPGASDAFRPGASDTHRR